MKFGVHLRTVRLNDPDPLAMLVEFVPNPTPWVTNTSL